MEDSKARVKKCIYYGSKFERELCKLDALLIISLTWLLGGVVGREREGGLIGN